MDDYRAANLGGVLSHIAVSNNRMWLTNKLTGQQVLLAKYYPSTGWYVFHDDIAQRLDKLFDTDPTPPSMYGNTLWAIQYEQEETNETDKEHS